MKKFMGIERYIKMETLPYDEIHHIDMHMKLLDEETILMAGQKIARPQPAHRFGKSRARVRQRHSQDGKIDRSAVMADLNAHGIGTSVHYPRPVPLMKFYAEKYGYRAGQFPVAEWLATQSISLPVGPHLQDGDTERIARAFKNALQRAAAA